MKRFIGSDSNRVGAWLCSQFNTTWIPDSGAAFGLEVDGELIAGVLFEGCNGASVRMHIAVLPGRNALDRQFLWFVFSYPFFQLRVQKVVGMIAETNMASRRFAAHLGARLEASLPDCCPDGALLFYTLTLAQCRWLDKKPRKFTYL